MQGSTQSPNQILLGQYTAARQTLETTRATLRGRLGSTIPDKLISSLNTCILELEGFEMAIKSLLNGYTLSTTAAERSHFLSEVLKRNISFFEIIEDVNSGTATFFSLKIAPSPELGKCYLVGDDIDASIDDTVRSLPNALDDIRIRHNELRQMIKKDRKVQQTVDSYYWAEHGLIEAFKAAPFKLTHKLVQDALDAYHMAGASDPQARQKLVVQHDTTVHPLSPVAGLEVTEEEIWERTELPPILNLAALNHHALTPVNDIEDPAYMENATDSQSSNDTQGENDTQDRASTPEIQNMTDMAKKAQLHHCFNLMRSQGANWIQLQPPSTLPKTVGELCSIEGSLLEAPNSIHSTETDFTNEGDSLLRQNLNDAIAIAKDSAIYQYRRIAVAGCTSHGKTSFINELIGEKILFADGRAATSWPLVIRHEPLAVVPELRITQSHFEPFLRDIANFKPSLYIKKLKAKRLRPPSDSAKLREWESWQRANSTFDQDVAHWESGTYTFPRTVSGADAINHMNVRIGQLIRIWYFCGLRKHQQFSDEQWPTLAVCMKNIEDETKNMRIEFVDLPGFGEKRVLKDDVTACWEAVIRNSHGVIVIFKAEPIQLDKSEMSTSLRNLSTFTQPNKPVIAIGTHLDELLGKQWSDKEAIGLLLHLWPEKTAEMVEKRMVLVSNAWHHSAPIVIQRINDNKIPFDYDVLAQGGGLIAMDKLLDKEEVKDQWRNRTPDGVKKYMERLIERSRFQEATMKVHLLALSAAKRQLQPQLSNAILNFNKVQYSNSIMLDMDRKKTKELEDLARQYEEFTANVIDFCLKWWQGRGAAPTAGKGEMEELFSEANTQAMDEISSLIESIMRQQEIKVVGQTLEFLDRETATGFFQKLEFDLRDALYDLQTMLLPQVRQLLEETWKNRVQELEDYFMVVAANPSEKSLRETIHNNITRQLSFSSTSIEYILSRLLYKEAASTDPGAKTQELPFLRARSQAEKIYQNGRKADPDRRVEIVQQTTGFKAVNLTRLGSISESFTEEENSDVIPEDKLSPPTNDLEADVINIVGVLGRPIVLATPPDLDLYPWEFLTVENIEGPIRIPQEEIVRTYSAGIIKNWHQIVSNDCLDSIDGAIDLCSALGLSIVTGDLRTHRANLKQKLAAEEAKSMHGDQLPNLVLAQANCCALVGAFEEVLKECARDDLDP
ncbi:hypothetical protein FRC19_005331 [Serendipita sp. 401]|nr:hypothetical protein FRC19_005331 [Serendipita sp. 401]KAG9054621.1 hypothetical protein FS842_004640 [Serendipita sp. 407]